MPALAIFFSVHFAMRVQYKDQEARSRQFEEERNRTAGDEHRRARRSVAAEMAEASGKAALVDPSDSKAIGEVITGQIPRLSALWVAETGEDATNLRNAAMMLFLAIVAASPAPRPLGELNAFDMASGMGRVLSNWANNLMTSAEAEEALVGATNFLESSESNLSNDNSSNGKAS